MRVLCNVRRTDRYLLASRVILCSVKSSPSRRKNPSSCSLISGWKIYEGIQRGGERKRKKKERKGKKGREEERDLFDIATIKPVHGWFSRFSIVFLRETFRFPARRNVSSGSAHDLCPCVQRIRVTLPVVWLERIRTCVEITRDKGKIYRVSNLCATRFSAILRVILRENLKMTMRCTRWIYLEWKINTTKCDRVQIFLSFFFF